MTNIKDGLVIEAKCFKNIDKLIKNVKNCRYTEICCTSKSANAHYSGWKELPRKVIVDMMQKDISGNRDWYKTILEYYDGKRKYKSKRKIISVKLSKKLEKTLETFCKKRHVKASHVVKEALKQYL